MTKKVLVVDNSQVILKQMSSFLEKKGYEVVTAENGLSALRKLEEFEPDLIFLDLIMPKISGDKLCPILRSMPDLKHVYVILLTAVAAEEDIDFRSMGADACIAKGPFKEVEKSIDMVLERLNGEVPHSVDEGVIASGNVFSRRISEELLSVKKHFESLLNHLNEGVLELTKEYEIVYANCPASAILATQEVDLLSKNFLFFFSKEDQERICAAIAEAKKESVCLGEFSPLYFQDRYLLMCFVHVLGGSDSVVVIINDISQRKKGEKKIADYYEKRLGELSSRLDEVCKENERLRAVVSARK